MIKEAYDPLVSIIVPVYNGEIWLRRCLDSLVYQTLQNIEIIAVDNGSTDNTWNILCEYAEKYPQKVIVRTIEHTQGPGSGRNIGLELARADYITFADADDYFEYFAMELFYNKAKEADFDIVYCSSFDVKKGKMKKTRTLASTDKAFVEQNGSMVYWNKLFKKELFQIAGKIPENIVFEDIAYVSTLISLSNKIGYIDRPLYYYILRDDSGVNDLSSDRCLNALTADDIAIENCQEDVRDQLIASILYRVYYDLKTARWTYADEFIAYLKKRRELFNIPLIKNDEKLSGILAELDGIDHPPMKKILYYNGFSDISDQYKNNIEKAFWGDGIELRAINEENCDIAENEYVKRLYQNKDFERIAKYFALKKIYETGGFYISGTIQMINSFNCLRYCESVWGFEDSYNFTDEVFGAMERSHTVGQILDTFDWNMDWRMDERIRYVLLMKNNVELNGKTQVLSNQLTVLSPDIFVTDLAGEYHICKNDYGFKCDDEYICVKKNTAKCLL